MKIPPRENPKSAPVCFSRLRSVALSTIGNVDEPEKLDSMQGKVRRSKKFFEQIKVRFSSIVWSSNDSGYNNKQKGWV